MSGLVVLAGAAFGFGFLFAFVLLRRFWVRRVVGSFLVVVLIPVLFALEIWSVWLNDLPYAAVFLLIAVPPPLAAGMLGGAVFAWLFRTRSKTA